MNIVNAGSRFQVYGEDVRTFKTLPVQTYTVGFHPQMGFWLTTHCDLDTNEDVIYGNHARRAEKILKSYALSERNFGVILSGKKGIGKSLLARMIAEKAIERGLPVIIVDTAIPGISDFLASIQQEVVIVFDEFEKTFGKDEDKRDPQIELLSLFDGIDNGKKLFIVTCNETRQLNEFLVNRPGRFHYHFEICCPTGDEVRSYMLDKLGKGFDTEIEKVVKLAQMADITYDCLRAITFDLRQGYPLEETLCDLNINYERDVRFDLTIRLSNGWILSAYSQAIDIYSKDNKWVNVYHDKERYVLTFAPNDATLMDGVLVIPQGKAGIRCDWDAYEDIMSEDDAKAARDKFNSDVVVEGVSLTKVMFSNVNKYVDV